MTVLAVEGITAGYGQLPVITDVSIRCEAGSIVSVLGSNGSGKSTLLKAICGLLPPMQGSVLVEGANVVGMRPYQIAQRGIGYVPQSKNVFPSLTVLENLEMGAFVRRDDIRHQITKVLDTFPDLKASPKKRAGDLSVGQRNLLGMARALMLDPKAILVDEPTAGLAPLNTRRIWDQLVTIAAAGAAVVVVEQNVDMAIAHSNWCYVLAAGRTRMDCAADAVDRSQMHQLFLGKVG